MKIKVNVFSWLFMIIAIALLFFKQYESAIVFALLDIASAIQEGGGSKS